MMKVYEVYDLLICFEDMTIRGKVFRDCVQGVDVEEVMINGWWRWVAGWEGRWRFVGGGEKAGEL